MSQVTAEIIADSLSPAGTRLTTFRCNVPKALLAQINTHRSLSRSAGSSRAIPTAKVLESAGYIPEHWPVAGPGMVPKEYRGAEEFRYEGMFSDRNAAQIWDLAMREAQTVARWFDKVGVHKSLANRPLEPYMMIPVILSATNWSNFIALRTAMKDGTHGPVPEAQWELYELSTRMKALLDGNAPRELAAGEWHLPFITDDELPENAREFSFAKNGPWASPWPFLHVSAARCARTTTNRPGVAVSFEKDLELGTKLEVDKHLSPFEHAAMALSLDDCRDHLRRYADNWVPGMQHPLGNFEGFLQARKLIENEHDAGLNR